MWTLKANSISVSTVGATLHTRDLPMTFADVVGAWTSNAEFRDWWSASLRAVRFAAFCFETPPLTAAAMQKPFECVFVESPALVRATANSEPFAEHFNALANVSAVPFQSLGGDAILIAPCPINDATDYAHLAVFTRTASGEQASELWKVVANALIERIEDTPVWLSTAGLGVSWLHVRLDSRPKYYRHRAYASYPF